MAGLVDHERAVGASLPAGPEFAVVGGEGAASHDPLVIAGARRRHPAGKFRGPVTIERAAGNTTAERLAWVCRVAGRGPSAGNRYRVYT